MRRALLVAASATAIAMCTSPLAAQDGARGAGAGPTGAAAPPAGRGRQAGPGYPRFFDPNAPFNPREIAGIWTPNGAGFGGGGRCRDCGDRGFSLTFPVFTAAG